MHHAILTNTPPKGGSWAAVGANGTNIRVAVVAVAERVRIATGLGLVRVYRLMDFVFLFSALIVIYCLLRKWNTVAGAMLGILLFSLYLPATMLFFYFHPWDRPSLLLWAICVLFAVNNKFGWFLLFFAIGIVVKFDSVIGLILYPVVNWINQPKPLLIRKSFAAAIVAVTTIVVLVVMIPGGFDGTNRQMLLSNNIHEMLSFGLFYPPVLVYGLLFGACLVGWKSSGWQMRALFMCGVAMLLPHILFTNFIEVRAQVGPILCMLPLAVHGFGSDLTTVAR